MIFVLTGNGKGKTTSAIGMGIRALGAGKRVLMVQFLKIPTSEANILSKLENFTLRTFGGQGFPVPGEVLEKNPHLREEGVREIGERDRELAKEGWDLARRCVEERGCDFLILDEITYAVNFGLLEKEEVLSFLGKFGKELDIVITGRDCPKEILDMADLITEMIAVRHPYEKGVPPRRGIEF